MSSEASYLYLSDEWFEAANQLLSEHAPVENDLRLAVHVTGCPDGDRKYCIILGPGKPCYETADFSAPVTMHVAWKQAVAIAQGNTNAQQAFLTGELQLDGDVTQILGYAKQLNDFHDAVAPLSEKTRWS